MFVQSKLEKGRIECTKEERTCCDSGNEVVDCSNGSSVHVDVTRYIGKGRRANTAYLIRWHHLNIGAVTVVRFQIDVLKNWQILKLE